MQRNGVRAEVADLEVEDRVDDVVVDPVNVACSRINCPSDTRCEMGITNCQGPAASPARTPSSEGRLGRGVLVG
jgi:hypothetical protein